MNSRANTYRALLAVMPPFVELTSAAQAELISQLLNLALLHQAETKEPGFCAALRSRLDHAAAQTLAAMLIDKEESVV